MHNKYASLHCIPSSGLNVLCVFFKIYIRSHSYGLRPGHGAAELL